MTDIPPSGGNEALAALAAGAADPPAEVPAASRGTRPLILFRIGARWFAVFAECVREVVTKGFITRVPTAPRHVVGVALVRGRLVPVVDFELLIGPAGSAEAAPTLPRLVVLESAGTDFAVVADETRGVIDHDFLLAPEARRAARPDIVADEIEWQGRLICLVDVAGLAAISLARGGTPA